ncbi:MAG TPA: J domain-containing protein [Candidatus Kapabacteria bacterium]|nr:J domain-containing protein [Candidatus Kapabacteria bacterium]
MEVALKCKIGSGFSGDILANNVLYLQSIKNYRVRQENILMSRVNKKIIDYYKVLGIDETSSSDDVRKAYLKMAKKYHPDRNVGNELALVKFTLINEAYNILGNLENRIKYKMERQEREHIHEQAVLKMKMKKKNERNNNKD